MKSSKSFDSWYDPGDDKQDFTIAAKAFGAAAERFRELFAKSDEGKLALKSVTRIGDVCEVVAGAKGRYDRGHEKPPKVFKWLQRLSASIHHYSNIFDVLVQHHPEYISLVWGAMKLLLVGVVNHEKTVTLLAKSLAEIAESLPRWEMKSQLYRTARIRQALEELYSLILQFLTRAYSWYNESKARHIIHSITQPPQLRYDDLLKDISDCSSKIDQLAIAGSQAELRDMHTELREVRAVLSALSIQSEASEGTLRDLLSKVVSFQAINSSALIDTNNRLSDLQLSQILSAASQGPLDDPLKCFQYCLFFRDRRASGVGVTVSTNRFWLSPKLKKWSSSDDSALITMRGSFSSQPVLRDFCVDVIQQLREAKVPVLWALKGAQERKTPSLCSTSDLLKYLTVQAVQLDRDLHTERGMAWKCSQFQRTSTATEWFDLFKRAAQEIKTREIYVVLDLGTVDSTLRAPDDFDLVSELLNCFESLTTKLKVIVVMDNSMASEHSSDSLSDLTVPVKVMRRKKAQERATKRSARTPIFPGNKRG